MAGNINIGSGCIGSIKDCAYTGKINVSPDSICEQENNIENWKQSGYQKFDSPYKIQSSGNCFVIIKNCKK